MNNEKMQKVISKMVSEQNKISSVIKASDDDFSSPNDEYYFSYPENKYTWSILKNPEGEINIYYYPSAQSKSTFLRFEASDMDYTSQKNLRTLFDIVRGKIYGFDDVLDDILRSSDDF